MHYGTIEAAEGACPFKKKWVVVTLLAGVTIVLWADSPTYDADALAREVLSGKNFYIFDGCVSRVNVDYVKKIQESVSNQRESFMRIFLRYFAPLDEEVRRHAIYNLLLVASDEYNPLKDIVTDGLGTEGERDRVLGILESMLQWNDIAAIYAVEAIGYAKHDSSVPSMIEYLNRAGEPERIRSIRVIAGFEPQGFEDYLQEKLLEDLVITTYGATVRHGVSGEAVLSSVRSLARGADDCAEYLSEVLSRLQQNPLQGQLVVLAESSSRERTRGLSTILLSRKGYADATSMALSRLTSDHSRLVRVWAAQTFVANPDPAAVNTLIRVYESDADAVVRWACIEGLGVIGGPDAEMTLNAALTDESKLVRDMAIFRLQQLRDREAESKEDRR